MDNNNDRIYGTLIYMALELFEGETCSFKSDLWSYICTIYEMLFLEKLIIVLSNFIR